MIINNHKVMHKLINRQGDIEKVYEFEKTEFVNSK
jgi:hypothetical protein